MLLALAAVALSALFFGALTRFRSPGGQNQFRRSALSPREWDTEVAMPLLYLPLVIFSATVSLMMDAANPRRK